MTVTADPSNVQTRLKVGSDYSRSRLAQILGVQPATLQNGISDLRRQGLIVIFITLDAQLSDEFVPDSQQGPEYLWTGPIDPVLNSRIANHDDLGLEIALFVRGTIYDYPANGFRYEGAFRVTEVLGGFPLRFRLTPAATSLHNTAVSKCKQGELEGEIERRTVNVRRRVLTLRNHALQLFGSRCMVCGFDFEETYGPIGAGFAEVHHIRPLCSSSAGRRTVVAKDLVVVCANCHLMLHRRPTTHHSIENLRNVVAARRRQVLG